MLMMMTTRTEGKLKNIVESILFQINNKLIQIQMKVHRLTGVYSSFNECISYN